MNNEYIKNDCFKSMFDEMNMCLNKQTTTLNTPKVMTRTNTSGFGYANKLRNNRLFSNSKLIYS